MKEIISSFVLLDQAAGQKQIAILEAFKNICEKQIIISGSINERGNKLSNDVIWEKAIKYNRKNIITRIYTWLLFTFQAYILIKKKYKGAELFIITNPPTSIFLTLFMKNKYRILVFDLYPDAFYEYGYLKNSSFLYKYWSKLNVKIFNNASRIYTLSNGMADQLSNYVSSKKIEIVDLWTDSSFLVNLKNERNWFVEKHNLSGKFVVLYSGNMGITHPVEKILEVAVKMKQYEDIVFMFIGGGHKFDLIKKKVVELNIKNSKVLPWLETHELPYSFNSAKLGIVTLDEIASKLSVPSKVFDLFAVGLPIIGIGAEDSELSLLLKKYKAGKCFAANEIDEIVSYILNMKENIYDFELTRKNSYNASECHTPKNALKFI